MQSPPGWCQRGCTSHWPVPGGGVAADGTVPLCLWVQREVPHLSSSPHLRLSIWQLHLQQPEGEKRWKVKYIHCWLLVMVVSYLRGYLQNFLYISVLSLYSVSVESRRRLIPFGLGSGRTSQNSWIPSLGQTKATLREFCGQTLPPTASSMYKHALGQIESKNFPCFVLDCGQQHIPRCDLLLN